MGSRNLEILAYIIFWLKTKKEYIDREEKINSIIKTVDPPNKKETQLTKHWQLTQKKKKKKITVKW